MIMGKNKYLTNAKLVAIHRSRGWIKKRTARPGDTFKNGKKLAEEINSFYEKSIPSTGVQ